MPNNANVDERVVEMRIDNRQFVSGAEKTITVLDKLKDALNFKKAGDGFSEVQKAADKVDLSEMAKNIESISDRFSSMGIVGMRVIQNLTDAVTGFVTNTIKGLTIDPMMGGFNQYGELTKSIDTVKAATREEIFPERYTTQMEYVNDMMERLMWYTDETSYSLQDMTSNIGKFTNAGVPLENALIEMEGITNWAGLSGASIQEASRAMYNLSQAIAVGSVKLMDWRSIENANMATREFKQAAIDTAVAVGTLTKKVDKNGNVTYETLAHNAVSAENFNEALKDEWFNSEVLQKTLFKFGEFSRQLNEAMTDMNFIGEGVYAADVLEWIDKIEKGEATIQDWQDEIRETTDLEEQGLLPSIKALTEAYDMLTSEENELGRRAFIASQQYKTFSDVIDATSDAVRTGWTKTFQYIIGDSEQSKKVWKAIGDEFYDIFVSAGDRRNKILKLWAKPDKDGLTGRDSMLSALVTLYEGIRTYVDPIIEGFDRVFSWGPASEAAEKLRNLTDRFGEFTKKIALSDEAVEGMANAFELVFGWVKKAFGLLAPVGRVLGTVIGYAKQFVELFFSSFYKDENDNILFDTVGFLEGLPEVFGTVVDKLLAAWDAVKKFGASLQNLPIIGTVTTGIQSAFDWIVDVLSGAREDTEGIAEASEDIQTPLEKIEGLWNRISEWIAGIEVDTEALRKNFGKLGDIISTAYEGIKGDPEAFKERIKMMAQKGIEGIRDALAEVKLSDLIQGARTGTLLFIGLKFSEFVTAFSKSAKEFETIPEAVKGTFESLSKAIDNYGKKYKGDYLLKMAAAILAIAAAIWVLSKIDQEKFAQVSVTLAVFFAILGKIVNNMSKGSSKMAKLSVNIFPKFAAGLIALAILVGVAAASLLAMSTLTWDQIGKGLTAMGLVLAAAIITLVILSEKLDQDINIKAIGKLVAIAMVIRAAGKAMSKLKDMSWSQIISAGVALGIVIAAISLALYTMSQTNMGSGVGSLASALGLVIVLYAIVPLLIAINAYIQKGGGEKLMSSFVILGAIAVLVAGFAYAMAAIGKKGNLVAGATGLLLIAAAFVAFGLALSISIPAILLLMNGLVDVMEKISAVQRSGKLDGVIVALVGIGAAMVLAGAGAILLGAGFAAFSAGLLLASVACAILSVALVPLAYAVVEFCNIIAENGQVVVSIISVVVTGVLAILMASKMKIGLTVVMIILTILMVIHEYGPQILNVLGMLLEDVLKFFVAAIPMIAKFMILAVVLVIDESANGIRSNKAPIISAIENFISAILELVVEVFFKLAGDLLGGLWGMLLKGFGEDSTVVTKGINDVTGWFDKIGEGASSALFESFGGLERDATGGAQGMVEAFGKGVNDNKDEVSGSILETMQAVYDDDVNPALKENGTNSGKTAITSMIDSFIDTSNTEIPRLDTIPTAINGRFDMANAATTNGGNYITGFGNGAWDNREWLNDVMSKLGLGADSAFKNSLGISSPSKVAYQDAEYFVMGLVNGIVDNEGSAYSATDILAIKMAESLRNALSTVQALAQDDFEMHPRITPVVDMSNVDSAASSVGGMFGSVNTRLSGVSRNMSNIESVASTMKSMTDAKSSVSQDKYEINIYPQPGMDEEAIADAVIIRLNSGIVRKGVALG